MDAITKAAGEKLITQITQADTYVARSSAVAELTALCEQESRDSGQNVCDVAYELSGGDSTALTWYADESTKDVLKALGYTKQRNTTLRGDKIILAGLSSFSVNVWLCATGQARPVQEEKPKKAQK